MKGYQKFIVAIVAMLTLYCTAEFIHYTVTGKSRARRMSAATRCFTSGDYVQARPALVKILTEEPANESACRMLAEMAEADRDYPAATAYYRYLVNLNPLESGFRSRLASMLAVTGQYGELLKLLQTDFNDRNQNSGDLLYYLEALDMTGESAAFATNLPALGSKPSAQMLFLYGLKDMDDRQYEKALQVFGQVRQMSDSPVLQYKTYATGAIAAGMLKADRQVEEQLAPAAKLVPALGAFPLARFYLKQGNRAEALFWLKECLKKNSRNTEAKLDLTDLYADEKNISALKDLQNTAGSRSRAEQECRNYLGTAVALYEHRSADARQLLDAAPQLKTRLGYQSMMLEALTGTRNVYQIPGVVSALLRISDTDTVRQYVQNRLFSLLTVLLKEENSEKADAIAAVLLPMLDDARLKSMEPTLKILLLSAVKRNDSQEILNYVGYLLRCDPEMPLALLAKGEALLAMNRPDKAVPCLKAIPHSLPALFDLARAYLMLSDRQNAGMVYQKAWNEFAGDVFLFSAYADFLLSDGHFDAIEQLIPSLPDLPEAKYETAIIRARIAEKNGRADEALSRYKQALDLIGTFPGSDENSYRKAYLYALTGEDAKAAPIYRQLLKKTPDSLSLLLNLSEVEAALGNHTEAAALAEKSARLYPDSPEAKSCLARRKAESASATP